VLQFRGHDVRLAADGAEALKIADQFRPDAVFLDIGMPKLNGYATAERIRGENWGRDVLLVAVTGWGQAEDKQRAKDAGFDAHFTKPLDPSVLDGLLAPLTSIQ
jgi:CheY-like chemotaxis protein